MKIYLLILILFLNLFEGKIKIENAWIRPSMKEMSSAAYLTITNNNDKPDTLYKAYYKFAKMTQVHETYTDGDMKGMREVKNLVIPANSKVELKPGGNHIMLMSLTKDLTADSLEEIKLYFKNAGEITVKAKVQDMSMKNHNHSH